VMSLPNRDRRRLKDLKLDVCPLCSSSSKEALPPITILITLRPIPLTHTRLSSPHHETPHHRPRHLQPHPPLSAKQTGPWRSENASPHLSPPNLESSPTHPLSRLGCFPSASKPGSWAATPQTQAPSWQSRLKHSLSNFCPRYSGAREPMGRVVVGEVG
jgi:hypothetical protein